MSTAKKRSKKPASKEPASEPQSERPDAQCEDVEAASNDPPKTCPAPTPSEWIVSGPVDDGASCDD